MKSAYINPVNDNDLMNKVPELVFKIHENQKKINLLMEESKECYSQIALSVSNAKQIGYSDEEIKERIGIIYLLKWDGVQTEIKNMRIYTIDFITPIEGSIVSDIEGNSIGLDSIIAFSKEPFEYNIDARVVIQTENDLDSMENTNYIADIADMIMSRYDYEKDIWKIFLGQNK
jgi:hypothetical protein